MPLHAQMLPLPVVPGPSPANGANAFQFFAGDEETYDSNLFRVPSGFDLGAVLGPGGSRGDHWNTVDAGVLGQWTIGQQLLLYSGEVDVGRFAKNTFLDNTSGNAKLTWDWRVGSLLSGDAGVEAQKVLAGFTNTGTFVKDIVDNKQYFGDAKWQVGPHLSLFAGIQDQDVTHSAEVVHCFECFKKSRGHRHRPIDSLAAFLEAFKNENAGAHIHAGRREGQCFGEATTGIGQCRTECPDRLWRVFSSS